jgi:hypothetical protein
MTIYSKKMKTTRRRDCIFLGGDFNWRIGEKGARNWEEEGAFSSKTG